MHALAPHLQLSNISFRYPGQDHKALDIERLTIGAGERVALIGASGSGKSTLLKLIDGRLSGWAGKLDVLSNSVASHGRMAREQRAAVGFVFQDFALIEPATVMQNVRNGRLGRTSPMSSLLGLFTSDDETAVAQAIKDVGLETLAERRVDQLSGGQRQRVAVARCLAQNPNLLLADEPVSSLDPASAVRILELLSSCATSRAASLIISSHRPKLITQYVNRIVALKHGRIVFDGSAARIKDDDLQRIYDDQNARVAA